MSFKRHLSQPTSHNSVDQHELIIQKKARGIMRMENRDRRNDYASIIIFSKFERFLDCLWELVVAI